jgi:hypothetical protein
VCVWRVGPGCRIRRLHEIRRGLRNYLREARLGRCRGNTSLDTGAVTQSAPRLSQPPHSVTYAWGPPDSPARSRNNHSAMAGVRVLDLASSFPLFALHKCLAVVPYVLCWFRHPHLAKSAVVVRKGDRGGASWAATGGHGGGRSPYSGCGLGEFASAWGSCPGSCLAKNTTGGPRIFHRS